MRVTKIANHLRIIPFFIFLTTCMFCGCTKSPAEKEAALEKSANFVGQLPIAAPDSTIQLIEAYIKDDAEKSLVYMGLIDKMYDTPALSSTTKLAYIAYLEKHILQEESDLIGSLYSIKGKTYYDIGKIDSSFILILAGIEYLKKGTDSLEIGYKYLQIGRLYLTEDAVLLGTEAALTGLKYFPEKEKSNNNNLYRWLKECLLNAYARKDNKKAKQLAYEMLQNESEKSYPMLYGTLGMAFSNLNQTDSAIWAIEKQADIFYKNKAQQSVYGFMNLGKSWLLAKQAEKAIACLRIAKQMADSANNQAVSLSCAFTLGRAYLEIGDFAEAEMYFKTLLDNTNFQKNTTKFKMLMEEMVTLKLKKSNDVQSLAYLKKAHQLADSIAQKDNNFLWADMNTRYKTSEKDKKIQQLALDKRGLQIQGLILLLILCVGLAFIYTNRQKGKLLFQENALLVASKQVLTLREQAQEAELSVNKKQLADFGEKIYAKNALIDEMQKRIDELAQNAPGIEQAEIIASKAKWAEMKILTDEDWENYLSYFEKAYPGFVSKVEKQYPNLTEGELRLFLIIYLGFDKYQIANILGISTEGVKKNRYRLKKKLNISDDENDTLDAFVKKIWQ